MVRGYTELMETLYEAKAERRVQKALGSADETQLSAETPHSTCP
jgi:hypothetical protein